MMLVFFASCNQVKETKETVTEAGIDSLAPTAEPSIQSKTDSLNNAAPYANARFRNVRVKETAADTYQVTGEGQIFEASFNWVVEDGHDEIASGYATTSAGAPAWGAFDFSIHVPKVVPHSTLHLIIFEASAKDGSRQHQLSLPLY
jgi:hypothetical protein